MGTPVSEWTGPLAVADPAPIAELRAVLVDAGFDGPTVRDVLAAEGQMIARPGDAPVPRRRLVGIEPLGTIASLFVLGTTLEAAAIRRAFAPLTLERLEALGLVEPDGIFARPRVRLVPHDDLLIVSDLTGDGEHPDHVAGVHNPSLTLSHLTVRRPVASALDVGTGCGVQAILASRHADRVVATDLNERALNFAAFNALLNDAGNIELRAGSFFARRRRALRARRHEPAVRDLAGDGVPLPRQRPRRGHGVAPGRPGGARGARATRVRHGARLVDPRSRRGLVGSPACLGRRQRLQRLVLVEAARVEQRVALRAGEWSIERIELQLTEGLRFQADIDPLIAHLFAGLDGRRTVAEVANAVAEAQGFDADALTERAVPVVREMVALGYLGGYG